MGLQAGGDERDTLDEECDPAAPLSPASMEESRCKSSPAGEMLTGRFQAHLQAGKDLSPVFL